MTIEQAFAQIHEQHGYITEEVLPVLVQHARLSPVLVRCGLGRFTCPAQDVAHFIAIIDSDGRDYVRDVSLPGRKAVVMQPAGAN